MSALKTSLNYWDGLRMSLCEAGYEHVFYFDTFDITEMIQGPAAFYPHHVVDSNWNFDSEKFRNPRTLVHNLVFAGFYSGKVKIGMLPAHQAEFNKRLSNMGVADSFYLNLKEIIRHVFRDGLELDTYTIPGVEEKNASRFAFQLNEWVNKDKESKKNDGSARLFKALHLTFQLYWHERLSYLFDKKYCTVLDYDIPFYGLAENQLFQTLKDAWDRRRNEHHRTKNNYNDAFAMFYLAQHVESFNRGHTLQIPIYFDKKGNFARIVQETGLTNSFTLNVTDERGDSHQFPAIRDEHYFQTYALLHADIDMQEVGPYRDTVERHQSMQQYFRDVLLETQSEQVDLITQLDKELNEYINYDFLRYVVLPQFGKDKFTEVYKVLRLNQQDMRSYREEKERKVRSRLETLHRQMHSNYQILETSREIYENMLIKIQEINLMMSRMPEGAPNLDVVYDYSLFRFFVPSETEDELRELFGNLLADEKSVRDAARIRVLDLFFRAAGRASQITIEENDLILLISTFWIFGFNKHISILRLNEQQLSRPLLMLIGASLVRDDSPNNYEAKHKRVRTIIDILVKRQQMEGKPEEQAKYAIALAYLHFQLWIREGGKRFVENNRPPVVIPEQNNGKAIEYARYAYCYYDQAKSGTNRYKLYATNLYIYYATDCGSESDFNELENVINSFVLSRGVAKQNWHFRYDDTIARYFHRASTQADRLEDKRQLAKNAANRVSEALAELDGRLSIRDIKDISDYKFILDNYVARLK